jgi:hypothetical protein
MQGQKFLKFLEFCPLVLIGFDLSMEVEAGAFGIETCLLLLLLLYQCVPVGKKKYARESTPMGDKASIF